MVSRKSWKMKNAKAMRWDEMEAVKRFFGALSYSYTLSFEPA